MQADGHDGVHLGDSEPVRQAVVERLLLDPQDGVERAGQQIVDLLAPLGHGIGIPGGTVHCPSFLPNCRFRSQHHTAIG